MPPDRPLVDTLGIYLTLHMGLDGASLQREAPWPPQLAGWRESFPLFQWMSAPGGRRTDTQDPPRFFGIRRLVDQAPFRLSDLRARGYRTESSRRPIRPPIKGLVEHYLIAEIAAPDTALVFLCMLSAQDEWYVLDEHRIVRD